MDFLAPSDGAREIDLRSGERGTRVSFPRSVVMLLATRVTRLPSLLKKLSAVLSRSEWNSA